MNKLVRLADIIFLLGFGALTAQSQGSAGDLVSGRLAFCKLQMFAKGAYPAIVFCATHELLRVA